MDNLTGTIIIIGIFALVVIAAFVAYRWRSKIEIKGPLGTQLKIDSSNKSESRSPGVTIQNVESRKGGVLAEDNTGSGAQVKDAKVHGDIIASSSPQKGNQDSKN